MSIFREYDVRGIADTDLTNPIAWGLGRALADLARARGDLNAYVGQDVRLSSPRLAAALSAGMEAGGVSIRQLDPGPTPLCYFAAACEHPSFKTKTGIMVTGSHNPPEYNGFKMVVGGQTLFGEDIQKLRGTVEKYAEQAPTTIPQNFQKLDRHQDYVDYVKKTVIPKRKIKVVVDAGNGAAGDLGISTYIAMGCDVIPLFCEPDGRFPNHHPDPTVPKNLQHLIESVKREGAELGIAYDGDGDRIGAVTASGKILFGDHLVLYFARDILKEIPGATIISEVKSSQILYDTLENWGAKAILWKTGHSLIKAKLKETHAALAGEMSGHMFFSHRYFGFDDAIYSGARLIEGLSQRSESLDQFLASLPPAINTPELRIECPDDKKFQIVNDFVTKARKKYGSSVNDIDGARIKIRDGWGLVRASNTQPVLVMRFEAGSIDSLNSIKGEFQEIFREVDPTIVVPN